MWCENGGGRRAGEWDKSEGAALALGIEGDASRSENTIFADADDRGDMANPSRRLERHIGVRAESILIELQVPERRPVDEIVRGVRSKEPQLDSAVSVAVLAYERD